jgi:cytosine/adenosine deaminase-related metal-dependent hydrolase
MRAPHVQAIHNPIANFVCCARGADAHIVLIDGRIVLRDGQFPHFSDVDQVVREAADRGRAIADAAGVLGASEIRWPAPVAS